MLSATWKNGGIMTLSFIRLALLFRVSEKMTVTQNRLRKEDLKENRARFKPPVLLKEMQCDRSPWCCHLHREMGTLPHISQVQRALGDIDPGFEWEVKRQDLKWFPFSLLCFTNKNPNESRKKKKAKFQNKVINLFLFIK